MNKEIDIENTVEVEEVDFLRKNISGIIDAAIIIAVFVGIASVFPLRTLSNLEGPVTPGLYILALLAIYRLISLVVFNGTIGMRICRIQILNDDLETLSVKEKMFASFFILINGVAYYRDTIIDNQ